MKCTKIVALATMILASVAVSVTRLYDVSIYRDNNIKFLGNQEHAATQVVVNTADSLLWCDIMIGDPSAQAGYYYVHIINPQTSSDIYFGYVPVTGDKWYNARMTLERRPAPMVRKGQELIVKVTHSGGDSVDIGMAPNAYPC
jgi:hypothetical protein